LPDTSDARSPFRGAVDGVRVALKVAPKAAADRIIGCAADAEGGSVLKVAVTAVPEAGKANDAVIALLAKAWKLPKRDLSIAAGAASRRKTLHVAGDPARLLPLLRAALGRG
jgi:uncharacterized protein (TIGR00251 family)